MNGGWPESVQSVQPGGGPGSWLARVWGSLRRAALRGFRPGHVAERTRRRVRECAGCRHDVVDGRDLVWVQNVCGVRFPPELTVSPFRDRFGLVRLGRPELALAGVLSCACAVGIAVVQPWLCWTGLAPVLFTAWFFRDPERQTAAGPEALVAPADGVLDDSEPVLRLGIYLSVFDVHVQRAPIAGRVTAVDYIAGRCVPTRLRGRTDGNAHARTTFAGAFGPVQVRQIAGPFASRVVNVVQVGDECAAGARFGLIKFGSRCEVWVPADRVARLHVRLGDRLRAGVSVLATLAQAPGTGPTQPGGNVPMQCSVTTSPRSR
jgi:phosphatidylserine decarboxylase